MLDGFCNFDVSNSKAGGTGNRIWQARRERRVRVLRTKMRREFADFMDEALGSSVPGTTPCSRTAAGNLNDDALTEEGRYNPRLHAARASDPDDSTAELANAKSEQALDRLLTASQKLLLQAAPASASPGPAALAGSQSASQTLKTLLTWAAPTAPSTASATAGGAELAFKGLDASAARRLLVPLEATDSLAGDASLSDVATDVGTPGTFGPSDGAFSEEASHQTQRQLQQQAPELPAPLPHTLGDAKASASSSLGREEPATVPGMIRGDFSAIQDFEAHRWQKNAAYKPGSIVAYAASDGGRPDDTLLEASRSSTNDEVLFGDVTPVAPAPSSATSVASSPSRRSMPSSPRRPPEEAQPAEQHEPRRLSGSLFFKGGTLPSMLLGTAGGLPLASSAGNTPSLCSPASSSGARAGAQPKASSGAKSPASTSGLGIARPSSPRVGRQLIAMARHWALHRAHPVSATPVLTYPSGASVDLRFLIPCMTSLINLNSEHHTAMLSMLQAGDHLRSALHTYVAYDQDHSGLLAWSNGEVYEFATKAFRQLGLHPPSREQAHAVYAELDRSRTGTLDATDCLCLVDVLIRLTFGLKEGTGASTQHIALGGNPKDKMPMLSDSTCAPPSLASPLSPLPTTPAALPGSTCGRATPQQSSQQQVEAHSPACSPVQSFGLTPAIVHGACGLAPQLPSPSSLRVGSPGPARSASRSPGPRRMSCQGTILGLTAAPAAGVQRQASLSPRPLRLHTPPRSPAATARMHEPFTLAANYLSAPRRPSYDDSHRATLGPGFCEATPPVLLAPPMASQVAWASAPGATVAVGGSGIGRRHVLQSFGTVGGGI